MKRPGGQSQFSTPLELQHSRGDRFTDVLVWIAEHLSEDLRVERLAQQVGMSARTFARAYVAAVGRTPAKTVAAIRLEAARRALEETSAAHSARPKSRARRPCGVLPTLVGSRSH